MERSGLGWGQRIVLVGAWLVSSAFVYVLGVYVGKGMRGGGEIAPRVALPVDAAVPPAPADDAQPPLTFYDVLGGPKSGTAGTGAGAPDTAAAPKPIVRAEAPKPAAEVPPAPPATEREAPAVVAPAPPPAASGVATAVPVPSASPAAPAEPVRVASPPPTIAAPPPAAPSPPPTVTVKVSPPPTVLPSAAPALPPQSSTGRWTVYASPSRDRLAVEHERAALHAKGFPAEVVTIRRDGDVWYRIRVGRYATQQQADEASRRLRSDGVGHAFVQSE